VELELAPAQAKKSKKTEKAAAAVSQTVLQKARKEWEGEWSVHTNTITVAGHTISVTYDTMTLLINPQLLLRTS
jgi:hypothetical protein